MKKFLLSLGLIGVTTLAACSSPTSTSSTPTSQPPPVATTMTVTISNFQFSPNSITVHSGTTVTWMNQDSTAHTVTGDNGGPSSGQIAKGNSYSYTFATAGVFHYHCSIHPGMTGTVVVQ